jgi:menaquinone-dependent protoporphyrinogen oxidase
MSDTRVLVAFASQAGSTAGIATTIAGVLRRSGLAADCRVASEVGDLSPYAAVVLGSGVFVPRRRSDGGGFLARHARELEARPLWLFSAGPIGRGPCAAGSPPAEAGECGVSAVARAVGARGSAVFGPIGLPADADPIEQMGPVNVQRVRAWAAEIAVGLRALPLPPAASRQPTTATAAQGPRPARRDRPVRVAS